MATEVLMPKLGLTMTEGTIEAVSYTHLTLPTNSLV